MKDMTEQEIDALIERAGLSDVMTVYRSAIEVDGYAYGPEGRRGFDGYSALSALLHAYGAQGRERCAKAMCRLCREESRMKVPTIEDIKQLALNSATIYNALTAHHQGHLTMEQALMLALIATEEELRTTRERLQDMIARSPGPGPIRF